QRRMFSAANKSRSPGLRCKAKEMRGGLVAGGISVPSSLCCRWTGQLANTSQARTGRSAPIPYQPKALPSSSAARQSALENRELEDAISKSPPSPSPSKAAAALSSSEQGGSKESARHDMSGPQCPA
ncbi:hypothetical protein HaLaN_19920, partial [Haematococcus lacustris]